jgi:hypothetical protein
VGRASALLGARAAGFAALLAALVVYYLVRERLPALPLWADVTFLALALMPAVFLLVWLTLPLRRAVGLLPVGIAFGVLAAICEVADYGIAGNFAKLAAMTAIGFWFLTYFETVAWVALIAFIIPWVDAWSVWRGPTQRIVSRHEDVFAALSFAYPVPDSGVAHLGLPDLLFFALFLAAASRFRLRPWWTWVGLTAGISATVLLATAFDVGGLPALPLLSAGFLLPNADLLWRRLRRPA